MTAKLNPARGIGAKATHDNGQLNKRSCDHRASGLMLPCHISSPLDVDTDIPMTSAQLAKAFEVWFAPEPPEPVIGVDEGYLF